MLDEQSNLDWLSPSGEERRREILRLALSAARRRRQRRLAAGGALIAALVGLLFALQFSPPKTPPPQIGIAHPAPPANMGVPIVYVRTDPDIVKKLAVPSEPPSWQMLSDDELLKTLASEGKPAGLAYVDGREILWTTP